MLSLSSATVNSAKAINQPSGGFLFSLAVLFLFPWLISACGQSAPSEEAASQWPTAGWPSSTIEAAGLEAFPFDSLEAKILAGSLGYVDRLFVVHDGKVVLDKHYTNDYRAISQGKSGILGCGYATCEGDSAWNGYNYYHPGWHPYYLGQPVHTLQSVTKSVSSALIGLALKQGKISSLEEPLLDYFQDYDLSRVDERLRAATLDDLLTMRSGIEWHEMDRPLDSTNTTGQLEVSDDWIQFTLDQPMDADPGTKWVYNSGGSHLMSGIIKKATGRYIDDYAEEFLFKPLGISSYHWKKTPRGFPDTEGGLYLAAEDLAKVGFLYLHEGRWEDQQLLPADYVRTSVSRRAGPINEIDWSYGYQWWRLDNGEGEEIWACLGFGDNYMVVLPRRNLIGVINCWNIFDNEHEPVLLELVRALVNRKNWPED